MTTKNNPQNPAERPFVFSRTFDAPRDRVWQAWTQRDRLMQWFTPKGFKMTTAKLDLRPGGMFHHVSVLVHQRQRQVGDRQRGQVGLGMYDFSVQVKVKAVEKNARILIEWPGESASTTVEWIFTPRPDGTTFVSITNTGFSGDQDQVLRQAIDSTEGFTLVLAGLKALLEHNIRLNLVSDRFPDALGKRGKEGKQ